MPDAGSKSTREKSRRRHPPTRPDPPPPPRPHPPGGLPGVVIVREVNRCRKVTPARLRTRHAPPEALPHGVRNAQPDSNRADRAGVVALGVAQQVAVKNLLKGVVSKIIHRRTTVVEHPRPGLDDKPSVAWETVAVELRFEAATQVHVLPPCRSKPLVQPVQGLPDRAPDEPRSRGGLRHGSGRGWGAAKAGRPERPRARSTTVGRRLSCQRC